MWEWNNDAEKVDTRTHKLRSTQGNLAAGNLRGANGGKTRRGFCRNYPARVSGVNRLVSEVWCNKERDKSAMHNNVMMILVQLVHVHQGGRVWLTGLATGKGPREQ